MDKFPINERVFVVKQFILNHSVVQTQRNFRREFNVERHGQIPTRQTIMRWVRDFENKGSVSSNFSGGIRTVRTPENIERVRQAVERSPTRSASRQSLALHISNRTLRRILHLDLKFHPYKIQVVHKLKDADKPVRVAFCRQFLRVLENDASQLNFLLMSDEAHFHLSGYVNKQNCRYWSEENPQHIHEQPLHDLKVSVWCGVSSFGIIGPYFFEENNQTVTINSERYVHMLETFLGPELRRRGQNQIWFQQDGATAHTARQTRIVLQEMFPDHLISRFGDITWPSNSPDLTAPDFFLWGYLKQKVYERRPNTIRELKMHISEEIGNIRAEVLESVMQNFRHRLHKCIEVNGEHLKDVIFKN